MPPLNFGRQSSPGRDGQQSAARLVNAYTEAVETDEGKSRFPVFVVPGLSRWDSATYAGAIRGSDWIKNHGLFVVLGNQLVQFISSGVAVDWGSVDGTGPVSMSHNQREVGPQLAIVTSTGAYYIADTALGTPVVLTVPKDPASPIGDGLPNTDWPAPLSVCYVSRRFVFVHSDGRVTHTDLDDGNTIDPLAFDKAPTTPNGLVRGVMHRGALVTLGPHELEIWQDVGTTPFAFAIIRASVNVGLMAPDSLVQTGEGLIWVDQESKVQMMTAAAAERISNHGLERDIAALTLSEKQGLRGTYYGFEGHKFYSLTSPGNFTWEFDIITRLWHQRETYAHGSWIGLCATLIDDTWIMGNDTDGKLYVIDGDSFTDGAENFTVSAVGQLAHAFPTGAIIDELRMDCVRGVGTVGVGEHSDTPLLMLDMSDDGGRTWFGGFTESLGGAGDYRLRIAFRRLGAMREEGRLFRLSCSAPVFRALLNAELSLRKLGR